MNIRFLRYIALTLITAALALLSSCEKNIFDSDDYRKVIILYMAANNNLSSYAQENITTMKGGFIPDKESKDILILYAHLAEGNPRLVRLYKDTDGTVIEDPVAAYEDQNSANGDVLKAVLNKVKSIFPSKEYGLILWSHATGWLPQGYYNSTFQGTYFQDPYEGLVKSFGEDRGVEMEIKELKSALPFHFNFIIFDCCFMGGIESVYELRDKANYIIASPTEILAYGFPYRDIMNPLFQSKSNLEEACDLFYEYYNSLTGVHQSATIALYKTDQLRQLATVTNSIFNSHRDKIATLDMGSIQPYFRLNKRWFWDLGSLVEQIATPSEFQNFTNALNKVVIKKLNTEYFIDIKIDKFSGISTYIQNPSNSFLDTFYKGFDWNFDSEMIK
jgi:hypothetical protein